MVFYFTLLSITSIQGTGSIKFVEESSIYQHPFGASCQDSPEMLHPLHSREGVLMGTCLFRLELVSHRRDKAALTTSKRSC